MNKTTDLFLIPPQIQDSCKLALPEGLKDLMSDITREVLRYQPRDLYKFIADYLSALLITRDNLSIAGYLYKDICQCDCEPELQRELRDIGLPESEINTARDIITNYFEKGPVQESNLMLSLIKETSIDQDMIPAVQNAIRTAFLRHQAHNTTIYESSSDSDQDEMMCAAKHTLDLYRKTAPTEENYEIMAEKIQKSYRAYGVKREYETKDYIPKPDQTKSAEKSVTLNDFKSCVQTTSSYDIIFPKTTFSEEVISEASWPEDIEIAISSSMNTKRITTISSTSLAGSYVTLPSYKPYSAHDCDVLSNLEEFPEREHAYIDYTIENPHISIVTEDKLFYKRDKKISFNDDEAKMGLEVDNDSDESDDDTFYHGEVMKIEDNDDPSAEIDRNDDHFDELRDALDDETVKHLHHE